MEQTISERAKWVSRTLAAIAVVLGLAALGNFIKILVSQRAYFQEDTVTLALGIAFTFLWCFSLFRLACRLWNRPKPKEVCLWTAALSVYCYSALFFIAVLCGHLVLGDEADLPIGLFVLVPLIGAGIFYLLIKKFLFYLLKMEEHTDQPMFTSVRMLYFLFLALIFWLTVTECLYSFFEKHGPSIHQYWWSLLLLLVVPVLLAVLFYKLCFWLFITKPLRTLRESLKDLNNCSPESSEAEPGGALF